MRTLIIQEGEGQNPKKIPWHNTRMLPEIDLTIDELLLIILAWLFSTENE